MHLSSLWLLTTTISTVLASPLEERQQQTYPCTQPGGVFVLAARGTDNSNINPNVTSPGFNTLQGLEIIADDVINRIGKGSYRRALPYAASPIPFYTVSRYNGANLARSIVIDYINNCRNRANNPNPRVVLLGYSQGADVMTSVLAGDSQALPPLPNLDAYKQYISGGSFIASLFYRANVKPIDEGNSTSDGLTPLAASDYTYLNNNYGNRVREYCQANDQFCAKGITPDAGAIHGNAVNAFRDQAIAFLRQVVR